MKAKEAKKRHNNKNFKEENKKAVKNKHDDNKKIVKEKVEKLVTKEEKPNVKVEKTITVSQKESADKLASTLKKVDDNRKLIVLFVVGFLLATLLFRCVLWPDRIATLKDGTQPVVNLKDGNFTADDLYTSMKEYYSVSVLLNDLDDKILSKL